MKAFVSIDIEGLPGISSTTMLGPRLSQFQLGSKIMTIIAKETAEKLLKLGFERVVVADSHGAMTNINYLEMPEGTTLIQGYPRPYSMLAGLDKETDAAFFIGYHAAAGTKHGVLDHTMSGRSFAMIKVNGDKASEYLLNALYAGEYGVPVALVAGDEALREEVEKYTPWAVFVSFKKGYSRYAGGFDSLPEVLARLRKGLEEAYKTVKKNEAKPLILSKPYKVEVIVRDSLIADVAEQLPFITRRDAYTLEFTVDNGVDLVGIIEVLAMMSYGVSCMRERLN